MYKVAVIGDYDSVFGFAALGLDVFYPDSYNECKEVFKNLIISEKYAAVFITESIGALISDEVKSIMHKPLPAIILLPGLVGNTGEGMDSVKKSIAKAVGTDILS